MIGGTLGRYIGLRFLSATLAIFVGILALTALIDFVEQMRRASDVAGVTPGLIAQISLFRVPQLGERLLPFCVLVGTMSCYLNLSRRNELVVTRGAGISAWQFVAPAAFLAFLLGLVATLAYNPISATLQEQSKRLENELYRVSPTTLATSTGAFWIGQSNSDGKAIINARATRDQGVSLTGVTIFKFDRAGAFTERLEAASAVLAPRAWQLTDVRGYPLGGRPYDQPAAELATNLTREQVRENFATPEIRAVLGTSRNTFARQSTSASWLLRTGYSSRSFWPGRSCCRRWCFLPLRSACVSSASAASRKWF